MKNFDKLIKNYNLRELNQNLRRAPSNTYIYTYTHMYINAQENVRDKTIV